MEQRWNSRAYQPTGNWRSRYLRALAALVLTAAVDGTAFANGGVSFKDIVSDGSAGIAYRRAPSRSNDIWEALKQQIVYRPADVPITPTKPRGMPGVAVFDYDRDGDLDIYVTNGPGVRNSLLSNQYMERGTLTFIDVAAEAKVDATDQDSTGVCFGDIDNDGDEDLYVLGNGEANRLFENLGNETFNDITALSGAAGYGEVASTCSFGDVNGDGLLDIVVANLFDNLTHRLPIMSLDFDHLIQHNRLFINTGNNTFVDKSATSGIQNIRGISWAIALVDYDLDGDLDLFVADDQGARPPAKSGGRDAGLLRLYENDGTGVFTDVTQRVAGGRFGAWMSLAFGDLNGDGIMDVFASNAGDYFAEFVKPQISFVPGPGEWSSGWFIGKEDGTFTFPGVGKLKATPFGWGSAIADYDNDGDLDIIYYGGWDAGPFIDASNPGAILRNDGSGSFTRDVEAVGTAHSRRTVNGLAVGDFNGDGFIDIVSVSNSNWPDAAPLVPYFSDPAGRFGGPFDDAALMMPTFSPVDPVDPSRGFTWNGIEPENGTLAIEVNSGNENAWVHVTLVGGRGVTSGGRVNRDGIGAVVSFHPKGGKRVLRPVVSGGTHASSHSLDLVFGMGRAREGTLEVLWPGGARNRLYNVRAGEHLIVPEIACSLDDVSLSVRVYKRCLEASLDDFERAAVIGKVQHERLLESALRAFNMENGRRGKDPDDTSGKHDGSEETSGDSSHRAGRSGQGQAFRGARHTDDETITFEDVSGRIPFLHLSGGDEGHGGAAWLDYDNDGFLDLFLTNGIGYANGLFRNNGDGTFKDVSRKAGIENGLGNSGVLAGDIDNDGFVDLFLTGAGGLFTPVGPSPVRLYHNNGDGTFSDITGQSGIDGLETSWGAAFGDINNDGYLDLLVATPGSVLLGRQDRNKLFLNNGDLTFTDISAPSGVDTALGGCLAAFSDYDMDGDQDILIGNCNAIDLQPGPIELFRNEGNLTFTNVTEAAGLRRRLGAWMGFAIADYDNDGDQDLFATNLGTFPGLPGSSTLPVLYENNGDGTFTDVDARAGVADPIWGWGSTFADFDNDGYADLFYAGSFPFAPFNIGGDLANPGTLYINNRDGTFTNRNPWLTVDLRPKYTTGVAAGDFDGDGFPDIAIVAGSTSADGTLSGATIPGEPVLLRNRANGNNWITVKTVGTVSNAAGVGGRVTLKAGGLTQTKEVRAGSSFLSTESPWLTFGLGGRRTIDEIEILWPSGLAERFEKVRANRTITLVEGSAADRGRRGSIGIGE